jgi:hypothetical protein
LKLPTAVDTVQAADILELLRAHGVLTSLLGLLFAIALFLGVLHEWLVFGDLLVVLIRHGKRELAEGWEVWLRVKRELTTWKSDPRSLEVTSGKSAAGTFLKCGKLRFQAGRGAKGGHDHGDD